MVNAFHFLGAQVCRVALAAAALAPFIPAASATEPTQPQVYGIWRGTLGTQEVMVNLKPSSACGRSSYYYLRHLWGIPLDEKDPSSGLWREGTDPVAGPTWTIGSATATTLEGAWTDVQGQHPLPLHLHRIAAGPQKPDACDGREDLPAKTAYNAPRLAAKTPKASDSKFKGKAYQLLSLAGTQIRTLQIPEETHSVPHLNQYLRQWLQTELTSFYDCQLNTTNLDTRSEPKPDYLKRHEPLFWNGHLLVLREIYSYYCGGAYPDGGVGGYLVWDLDADQAVAPESWFQGAMRNEYSWELPPKLKALFLRRFAKASGGENECVEAVRMSMSFEVFPSAKGLMFRPSLPHVIRSCEDETLVPWRELQPFLTPAGAQFVREKILETEHP